MKRILILAAAFLVVGVISIAAQETSSAKGQLVKVDPTAHTLIIKTASAPQLQFVYTADTKVVGADEGVAGLATMSGADVTVQFVRKGQDNVATQIEVQKKP